MVVADGIRQTGAGAVFRTRDEREWERRADVELSVARMRWVAVVAVPLVLWLYRAPAGVELPLPGPTFGLIAVPLLIVANLIAYASVRTGSIAQLRRSGVAGMALDLLLTLIVIFNFGVDTESRFWPLLVIVIIEAAGRWGPRGSVGVATLGIASYAWEQVLHLPLKDTPGSWVSGVGFAAIILMTVAVGTGTLASRSSFHRAEVDRQNSKLLDLAALTREVTAQHDAQGVFDHLVEGVVSLTNRTDATFLEHVDGDAWARRASVGLVDAPAGEVERSSVLSGLAQTMTGPELVPVEGDLAVLRGGRAPDGSAVVVVPIVGTGGTTGLFLLGAGSSDEPLTEAERSLLHLFAGQAAVAAESARLIEQEHRTIDELRRLDDLKDDFVAILSHELRSPLVTIGGYAQLLRDRWPLLADEQRETFLTRIAGNSERLAKLVNDVLETSQAERSELPLAPRSIDIEPLVREAAELEVGPSVKHHLTIRVEPPIPLAMADPDRVSQVLHNLLSNAVKYSPDGGRVTVDIRREGHEIAVGIADDGIGIDAESQATLFGKFHRLEAGRHLKGTGLGLYLSRRIVEAMGGRIDVRSSPGSGSEFTVRLPLASRTRADRHTEPHPDLEHPR